MSKYPDPELGREPDEPVDGRRDDPMTTTNQPLQGKLNFGDSSGRLFSIYSKAAEDEDNKLVERWQKDADGILIFTGLFSAAVAALLAVTVQDLRPSSQDTSAFYLGNIYQVLADPSVTHSSIPSPVVKPPPFSPSRYAVWVNTLWFLSLLMSVSCALWATSLHQWARRYLRRSQPSRCNPEKRARMRAFYAEGVGNMHIPWAVEGLPTLLHLSLFLFFGGVAVFLFNVNREVFNYVICWIGLFCLVYGMITLLPLIRHDSPYNSPLSTPAWFLFAITRYIITMIYSLIIYLSLVISLCFNYCFRHCFCFCLCFDDRMGRFEDWVLTRIGDSGKHRRRWMLKGVEMAAEEAVSKRLSRIDVCILDWTITSLGDDDSVKNFFEAIPGFLNSELVKHLEGYFPEELSTKYRDALDRFLDRTSSSNLVDDAEKLRRVDIATNAISLTRHSTKFFGDKVRQVTVARILLSVRKRDDRWITLAARFFDLPEQDLQGNIDDSVLLATLIRLIRPPLRSSYSSWKDLEELSELDIRNTPPGLQHGFCTVWNEIVQEARKRPSITPVRVLKTICQLYITLHQGTDAAPTAFTDNDLWRPSSYPLCNLVSHRPHSIASHQHQPSQASPTESHVTPPTNSVSDSSHFAPPPITSSVHASHPTGSPALPRLRARGLINSNNICFANAVLQLLVNLPLFWNLFRELGDQMGQRSPGVPEAGGSATPLVDATVGFVKEFIVEDKSPSTEQQSQPATGGTPRADEEKKDENAVDPFKPTYMYDAMKEKRQLKPLLDGQQQDAEEFLRLYLDALDEELPALLASISCRQSGSAALEVEEREVSQSGQTGVRNQGFVANFVESPITRIFGGKFCSLVHISNKPDVVTTEDWRSLHLDILPDSVLTVQDAFMRVSQSQSMLGGPSGLSDSDASQQILIEALPPVLILHLKRFRYDAATGSVIKIGKPIQFSPKLDIPFDIMAPTARQPAKPTHYTLCGVLYHHGESAGGGHYSVDVLHHGYAAKRPLWLHIDDEVISPVRHEDVFREQRAADERCAYLLFYCRTSPKDT